MEKILLNLIVLILLQFSNESKEIDFYANLIPERRIIICSDKENLDNNLIFNEFLNKNGFTCLIKIKKNGLYRVNLHLLKIDDKHYTQFKDLINKNKQTDSNLIDLYIGQSYLFNDIETKEFHKKTDLKKQFWIRLSHGKISYIRNNTCEYENIEKCEFEEAKDSLIMKTYLKINFYFKKSNFEEIILLENKMASRLSSSADECDPPCVNGACNDGDCACQLGYMGINCSISNNNF
jgi:hypothetical protein